MKLINTLKLNVSILAIMCCMTPAVAEFQSAWDNPNANMAAGSSKPGYANLTWSTGTVLPIKTRSGMATLVTLPNGEKIADIVTGNDGLFHIDSSVGEQTMYITPTSDNAGNDTNMIVTGQSGNKYIFYLRAYPVNSSEITYSQVDISTGGGSVMTNNATNVGGAMGSVFKKSATQTSTIGVDGEDYGWIKTMKIDPSEFRFDLDIFVPNPDDYVIAPERVWRDRIFTYIDFGDKVISMTQRPVVSLMVEGGESPVGFRTDGEDGRLLIVEAVGDMVLRSGQRIVCIKKRAKPFLIADTASVMALAEANVAQSMAANQSLNAVAYNDEQYAMNANINDYYSTTPTYVYNQPNNMIAGAMDYSAGNYNYSGDTNMMPNAYATAGSYLPQTNIPLITSNQTGVAVELKSDTSVKALNDYWTELLAKFSGDDGVGLLSPYKNSVFFAVDEQGVGDLGADSATARLYRLRIGPLSDIDTAQQLCDQLLKFSGASCHVVRIQ